MPYASEKIKLKFSQDRRRKLSEEDIARIKRLGGTMSMRQIAKDHGVCPRTIDFILHPEKRLANLRRRKERGGWRQYYNKDQHRETMKEHRTYKHALHVNGELEN